MNNLSPLLNDPMIALELAAVGVTLLYLLKLTLQSPMYSDSHSAHLRVNYLECDMVDKVNMSRSLLHLFNVGNLISWPKRSLNNQRVK